jgi:hypothetical protein
VQHPRPKTIASLTLALGALTGLALAQPAPTGVTPTSIRRSTAGSSNLGEFPEDSGVAVAPSAPMPRGEVGGTGTVDHERGPQGQLRGSSGAAPGEIDYSRPIGAADVARLLRTQEPRLRTCYDAARATHPRLAGRVALRLVVSRTGELTNVEAQGFPDAPDGGPVHGRGAAPGALPPPRERRAALQLRDELLAAPRAPAAQRPLTFPRPLIASRRPAPSRQEPRSPGSRRSSR